MRQTTEGNWRRPVTLLIVAAAAPLITTSACVQRHANTSATKRAPAIDRTRKIPVDDYFPLTPRSYWTYRIRDLAKNWTYTNTVQVQGRKFYEPLRGKGTEVVERYSSEGGPFYVEESEPIVYFRQNGFLNRMFMTLQGGKLVQASGS